MTRSAKRRQIKQSDPMNALNNKKSPPPGKERAAVTIIFVK
jgi:hypothetical protein